MKTHIKFLFFILLFCESCSKDWFFPQTPNTPEGNFDYFWSEFDKYYPYFELKKIDWDSMYRVYRPEVTANTTDKQLYDMLKKIALDFQDGHVNVFTSLGTIDYTGWYNKYPSNKLQKKTFLKNYVQNAKTYKIFDYGLTRSEIGYIAINSFDGDASNFDYVDSILIKLNNPTALILDLRDNSGGLNTNSAIVSSRFTGKTELAYKTRYRNGKNRNSFTSWEEYKTKPVGSNLYTRKVAVLTNRSCFSAAEDFLMLMKAGSNCKLVGDTTGGGSGNPVIRVMPNGWYLRFSTWQSVGPEGDYWEGKGIYPDIPVNISLQDTKKGIDTIMETALAYLISN